MQPSSIIFHRLLRFYGMFAALFVGFVLIVGLMEMAGFPNKLLGYLLLFATILIYASIGFLAKTANIDDYYVAGRRVPAFFNGMATGADWMSAASFIGMAGTLYLSGYEGLAYIMGWTGGYCLVALLLAPYLRRFGQYTIPDFLGARYAGHLPRLLGVVATLLCSFTYLVAQIYGVGLIASRFTGLEFTIGVFVGLAGILVCSFLGGMKAVTWTQVAQYLILILAYLIPVVWLSVKHTGNPVPQVAAYTTALPKVSTLEMEFNDPYSARGAREEEVRQIFRQRAAQLDAQLKELAVGGVEFLALERQRQEAALVALKITQPPVDRKTLAAAERALKEFPADPEAAIDLWQREKAAALAKAQPVKAHAEPFAAAVDEASRDIARKNFLALVAVLMIGTAALPHILVRYYTTPSVRETRNSVVWSLFFILLLYITAPALAILVKFEVYDSLVGTAFSRLPAWVSNWAAVDKALMSITDINKDGIVQLAEITLGSDLVVLATPEIAGLPYVISGLVAVGGLAAALSTADGLLLTISNALAHDVYFKMANPQASAARRIVVSKALLLVAAVAAAYITSLKPGDILFLVGSAFSMAAAGLFPALVCGVFWRRANRTGAAVGMLAGLGVCIYYIVATHPFFRINAPLWWDIQPICAGIFGIPAGFAGILVGSLLTRPPTAVTLAFIDQIRYPHAAESTHRPTDAVSPAPTLGRPARR